MPPFEVWAPPGSCNALPSRRSIVTFVKFASSFGTRPGARHNYSQQTSENIKRSVVLSLYTLSLVQANLKRRHFVAVVVVHVAIGIQRRAFWDLKALVVVEAKRHQVGQLRELFRDAAWHHPAAQNLKFNKNQHKTHAPNTGTEPCAPFR